MEDNKLVQKASCGDQTAFRELMLRYKDYVFSIAYGMIRRGEVAEELTQDVFIKVYKNIDRFQGDAAFKTWIYRITKNTVLSYLRKNRLEVATDVSILANTMKHATQVEHGPSEEKIILHRSMEELIPDDKLVLTLFYMEETKIKDIANILGLSENTIKVKLHRARKRLKSIMENAKKSTHK